MSAARRRVDKRAVLTNHRNSSVCSERLGTGWNRAAYGHEVIVQCSLIVSADELTVQSVEPKADASVHGALKHSTEFDELDSRLVFCRQGHFGHRLGIVKVQYVYPSLIVSPKNIGRLGDALHRRTEACCRAV